MFHASRNASLVGSLALTLAACGGGGDGADRAGTENSFATAPARLMAITIPHWTTFPIEISRNPDGSEMLNIPDPKLGMQRVAIRSRDAQGNLTALDNTGPFTGIIGFLNNRIGMICGADKHFKDRTLDEFWGSWGSGHYLYLSDEFIEVDYRELFGHKYKDYDDCKKSGEFAVDAQGNVSDLEDPSSPPAKNPWKIFTPEGAKLGTDISAVIDRAKAYKYISNGKPIYVVVGVLAIDPAVPEARPTEQKVYFALSD